MKISKPTIPVLTVSEILNEQGEAWRLRIIAGREGLGKRVTTREVERPGLLLAGFETFFPHDRIQILGQTEFAYLGSLGPKKRAEAIRRLFSYPVPAVIVTRNQVPLPIMRRLARKNGVPLIVTPLETTDFIGKLTHYLSYKLAPRVYVHGTFVDVYGVGILLTGRAGIGKSECALDLVSRGHRLVADDTVEILHHPTGQLTGRPVRRERGLMHYLEVRGFGVVDVYSLYGIRAVRDKKKLEVEVHLVDWSETLKVERLGLHHRTRELLGVEIPYLEIPMTPGKNISTVIEVVAMDYLLSRRGFRPAAAFEQALLEALKERTRKP